MQPNIYMYIYVYIYIYIYIHTHWRRKWQPTPVHLSGKSHGRRSLVGYTVHGIAKSQIRLSNRFYIYRERDRDRDRERESEREQAATKFIEKCDVTSGSKSTVSRISKFLAMFYFFSLAHQLYTIPFPCLFLASLLH